MSTLGWLAAAGAVGALAPTATTPARVGALAERGRLTTRETRATRATHRQPAARGVRWSRYILPATALGAGLVWVTAGVALAIAAAAIGATTWQLVSDLDRRRAAATVRAERLAAVRLLVGELQAGARPAVALVAAAELAPHCAATLHAAAVGASGAGDAASVLCRDPDTRLLGLAWRLGEDTGAALAEVLGRLADDLAADEQVRRAVGVALAGPRASAVLLGALPLLGLALGALMGARPWAFLAGPAPGRAVCCVGVLLDLAGLLWLHGIMRRAERS
jgi:tight adherence protein B